jgi:hypothetical protein
MILSEAKTIFKHRGRASSGIIFYFTTLCFVLMSFNCFSQDDDFTEEEKEKANTAVKSDYLSQMGRGIIYNMNLCRINPQKFLKHKLEKSAYIKENEIFLKQSPSYLTSLKKKLKSMKSLDPINPDKALFETALCLALQQEKSGEIGHTRKKCKSDYYGECCSYGMQDAEGVVIQLLIDLNVPSLGHREILLGKYTTVGVASKGHKKYGHCTVLDFK